MNGCMRVLLLSLCQHRGVPKPGRWGRVPVHSSSLTRNLSCVTVCVYQDLIQSADIEKRFLFFFLIGYLFHVRKKLCPWPYNYNTDIYQVSSRSQTLYNYYS